MKPTIIVLPGILAHPRLQHAPLNLGQYGQVEYIEYQKKGFDPDEIIQRTFEALEHHKDDEGGVIIIGTSIGGSVAAFALQRLREQYGMIAFANVEFVAVDPPAGSKTFAGFEWAPVWLVSSRLFLPILWIIGLIMIPVSRNGAGLPKDEYITVPSYEDMKRITGRDQMLVSEWQNYVKDASQAGLQGHSAWSWACQIRWMANRRPLERALRFINGIDITYVECTGDGNEVVSQPDASKWWHARAGSNVWQVEAPHCGYLQMQAEFAAVFDKLLSRP